MHEPRPVPPPYHHHPPAPILTPTRSCDLPSFFTSLFRRFGGRVQVLDAPLTGEGERGLYINIQTRGVVGNTGGSKFSTDWRSDRGRLLCRRHSRTRLCTYRLCATSCPVSSVPRPVRLSSVICQSMSLYQLFLFYLWLKNNNNQKCMISYKTRVSLSYGVNCAM